MKIKIDDPLSATRRERGTDSGLTLKKRPLVSLDEGQMAQVAGGHPHPPTCEPTCAGTCGDKHTCAHTCRGTCPGYDTCDDGGCDPNSTSPDRCV